MTLAKQQPPPPTRFASGVHLMLAGLRKEVNKIARASFNTNDIHLLPLTTIKSLVGELYKYVSSKPAVSRQDGQDGGVGIRWAKWTW